MKNDYMRSLSYDVAAIGEVFKRLKPALKLVADWNDDQELVGDLAQVNDVFSSLTLGDLRNLVRLASLYERDAKDELQIKERSAAEGRA